MFLKTDRVPAPAQRQYGKLSAAPGRQRGFLMLTAIFILVVLGFFSLTISRNTTRTHFASTLEGVSLQAFYAAESGAQYAMNQLFYNAPDRLAVDVNCAAVNGDSQNYTVAGLSACSSTVSCSSRVLAGVGYYTVRSTGSCGSGSLSAQRTIAVSALME